MREVCRFCRTAIQGGKGDYWHVGSGGGGHGMHCTPEALRRVGAYKAGTWPPGLPLAAPLGEGDTSMNTRTDSRLIDAFPHPAYLRATGSIKITPTPPNWPLPDADTRPLIVTMQDDSTVTFLDDGTIGVVGNDHITIEVVTDDDGEVLKAAADEQLLEVLRTVNAREREYEVTGRLLFWHGPDVLGTYLDDDGVLRLGQARWTLPDGSDITGSIPLG